MTVKSPDRLEFDQNQSTNSLVVWSLIFLAVIAGTLLASMVLPSLLPGLETSLTGETPKAYWYLSRGSAMAAFGLLWMSMAFGMIITNKMARVWPGGPTAFDLHEYTSLLGMAFALFHAMILMGDHYINYSLAQVFTPFASQNYRPVWVGLGQVAFYVWVLVTASFYMRKRIGTRTWRVIHYASFFAFIMALLHGITSGTDTGLVWTSFTYWFAGGSLLFLLFYRILAGHSQPVRTQRSGE